MIVWCNPDRVSLVLKEELGEYEKFLLEHSPGASIQVHEDWADGTGHTDKSRHYTGEAADFHVVGASALEVWLGLERFPRLGGVGYYPDWKPVPGFHVDVRVVPFRARWARVGRVYVAMDRKIIEGMVT